MQRFRHEMGLDLPWYRQYAHLAGNWARLRFGNSIIQQQPVATIIKQQLPRTAEILGLSILFSLLLAIPIGIIAAVRQYSLIDNVVTVLVLHRHRLSLVFPCLYADPALRRPAPLAADPGRANDWATRLSRRSPQASRPAGAHADAHPDRGVVALHSLLHARSAASGLHPHRPRQGAGGARGAFPATPSATR